MTIGDTFAYASALGLAVLAVLAGLAWRSHRQRVVTPSLPAAGTGSRPG